MTVNAIIEPSPEGAIGKSYLVYPGVQGISGDGTHNGHVGGYQDVYVKTAQGWRFKKRIHVFPPDIPGSYVFPARRSVEQIRRAQRPKRLFVRAPALGHARRRFVRLDLLAEARRPREDVDRQLLVLVLVRRLAPQRPGRAPRDGTRR